MSVKGTEKKRRTKGAAKNATQDLLKEQREAEEAARRKREKQEEERDKKIAEERRIAAENAEKQKSLEDHPKYYERALHDGSHSEIIIQLCEVFPYVMEAGSIPVDWFFKKIKSRFTFASKNSTTICYFFDDPWEAQALYDDWIKPKIEEQKRAEEEAAKKKEDKKAALRAKMAAKGL